jgi:Zn-dependent oligopeptidase
MESLDSILQVIKIMEVIIILLMPALILYLEKRFVTRTEFNHFGDRLTGVQTIATNANSMADIALDKAVLLEKQGEERWERNVEALERISKTVERVSDQLTILSNAQIVTTRDMKYLSEAIAKVLT